MPTPVSTARQCLTDEAAKALDDAVSIARRRSHPQTSSVHVLSSLLSPSFSLLRESLSRCRSSDSGVTTRLQFRVLDLCINVALDKLYTPKNCQGNISAPPIANSLMAAIKRAQANQRRQPEMYHLTQVHFSSSSSSSPISISGIKVELKHLILSILDDPIVSRVLGDAGYLSHDIKIAIIHPPLRRWGTARCPPMFMDFPGFSGDDENCRRIGEVMAKGKEKNPILTGVCAKDAISSFRECLLSGKYGGIPNQIHGVKFVCMEREIREFLKRNPDGFDSKLKEVTMMMENSESSHGVVVNLGELRVLMKDEGGLSSSSSSSSSSDSHGDVDLVNELVMKLNGLIEVYGKKEKKLWVIGAAANCETYSKFLGRFPSVERDWDLQPLPITSSRSSFDALGSKSSLMGSFVPFGGFFPSEPNYVTPLTIGKQTFTRCNACNEMYERDLSAILREVSSSSIADMYSKSLSSSLQRSDSDLTKGGDVVAQTKDVKRALGEQILDLQKKWNEHCRNLHQILPSPASIAPPPLRPQPPHSPAFQFVSDNNKQGTSSSSNASSTAMQIVSQNLSPQHNAMTPDFPKKPSEPSQRCLPMRDHNLSLPSLDYKLTPSVSVTTELDLGTIYAPKSEKLKKPLFQDQGVQHLQQPSPSSISSYRGVPSRKEPEKGAQPPSPGFDVADYKLLFRKLTEVVAWQGEAMSRISEIVTSCRSGVRTQRPPNKRGNIWLMFHGPDKIGKRRAAEALADALFGSRDRLIAVDLSARDTSTKANSLLLCHQLGGACDFDISMSRMTVVDHIARELSRGPHSVVFLENIDEADPLLQNSLSRALETGKFPDSRGREISIGGNVVFIASSSVASEEKSLSPRKEFVKFPEEKVLEAQNWQMQVTVRTTPAAGRSNTRVSLVTSPSAKRKACDVLTTSRDDVSSKIPKHSLDLNLPCEEETAEFDNSEDNNSVSDISPSWLEGFFGLVDGNVGFKPFNFDVLADGFLTKIRAKFEEIFRGERERVYLEIEDRVMVQILAASWLCAEKQGGTEEWIEQVVGGAFCGARERVRGSGDDDEHVVIVRLGSCEGVAVNQWASGILLPRSINLSI